MERLNFLKKEKNISNYRLAKDLKLNESTIRSWIKGRAIPRDNKLQMLADYFHVHPAWLKYGDKQYAPTLKDEIFRIAEKMQSYTPETIKKISKIVDALDDSRLVRQKAG